MEPIYSEILWAVRDLNPRTSDYESAALTAELTARTLPTVK